MKTKPLPPMGQDPSIVRGQEVRAEFVAAAQSTRQDRRLTNRQVAEQIVAAWESANSTLANLYEDLQNRRNARLEDLESVVPIGPAIPAGASPADVVVIQQAFRTALAQARQAMPSIADPSLAGGNITPITTPTDTLDAMLADAEKFGDDTLRRAVLTAALETGNTRLVRSWTDLAGVTDLLDELADLISAVAGQGQAGSWNFTVFRPLPAPPEVAALQQLKASDARAAEERARQAATATTFGR